MCCKLSPQMLRSSCCVKREVSAWRCSTLERLYSVYCVKREGSAWRCPTLKRLHSSCCVKREVSAWRCPTLKRLHSGCCARLKSHSDFFSRQCPGTGVIGTVNYDVSRMAVVVICLGGGLLTYVWE